MKLYVYKVQTGLKFKKKRRKVLEHNLIDSRRDRNVEREST